MRHKSKSIASPGRFVTSAILVALICGCGADERAAPQEAPEPAPAVTTPEVASDASADSPPTRPTPEDMAAFRQFAASPGQAPMILPSPSAILAGVASATGKERAVRLSRHIRHRETPAGDPTPQLAMRAGILIADFFVYVHEKDATGASQLASELLALADAMDASEDVRQSGEKLSAALGAGDWETARQRLDDIYRQLSKGSESEDGEPSTTDTQLYVLLGGWIEAVHLVTSELESSYDEGLAELLNQGAVADYLSTQLASRQQDLPQLQTIKTLLDELHDELATIPAQDEIHGVLKITSAIREST